MKFLLKAAEQYAFRNDGKIGKLLSFDFSYFLGQNYFGNDGFQNMFVHQPTSNMRYTK